jgi:TetR/AcrR family transcriptional regulator, fatty acid biosynthesis regulator
MGMKVRSLAKPVVARGKSLLMNAALKLAMKTRSIGALGVREIGREAGLNPNTFYRHFSSLEDLGLAILDEVIASWRQPLRDIRRNAAEVASAQIPAPAVSTDYWAVSLKRTKVVAALTIEGYFDFVIKNPEAFLIGVGEMSGSSSKLRQRLHEANEELASDLAADIRIYQLLPMLSDATLRDMSAVIIRQIITLSTDYIDVPRKREEMRKMAYDLMISLVAGAIALEVSDRETMHGLAEILRDSENCSTRFGIAAGTSLLVPQPAGQKLPSGEQLATVLGEGRL